MPRTSDLPVWILCSASAVAFACASPGSTLVADEGTGGETSTSTSTSTSEPSTTGPGPECETFEDCGDDADCVEGMCVPTWPDPPPGQECIHDDDCPADMFCEAGYCVPPPNDISPECEPLAAELLMLTLTSGPAVALSFVDTDEDGVDELAVATESQIELFDGVADMSTSSAREPWPSITAMVAGQLDGNPGEDLALVFNHSLWRADALDASSFNYTVAQLIWIGEVDGVVAGQFEPSASDDLLIWGPNGARLLSDSGSNYDVYLDGAVTNLTALGLDSDAPSVMLGHSPFVVELRELDGSLLANGPWSNANFPLVPFVSQGKSWYVGAGSSVGYWQQLVAIDPLAATSQPITSVPVPGYEWHAADLDGDGEDELLMSGNSKLLVELGLLTEQRCSVEPSLGGEQLLVASLAVGDWDGDGDDDVALRFADGQVGLWIS